MAIAIQNAPGYADCAKTMATWRNLIARCANVTDRLKTAGLALCLALLCAGAVAQSAADLAALETAAQRGEVQALIALALKYERGKDVERDFVKSNDFYCKAAARGDIEALLKLGVIYSIGRGVLADEGVAALLIGKAAALGNERAQQLLEHVSRGTASAPPACLAEPFAEVAEAPPLPAARSDLELMVQRWAPEYAIDPALVMALISAESNFNPNAVSPKNAQGLMQLIPATARRFGVKNAFNPLENLKGGLAYLKWLMAYFKGEVVLVLAAYNSGEETVERYRGIPPYKETRDYVRQITRVYKNATHPYVAGLVAPSPVFSRSRRAE